MQKTITRNKERGHANHGWLQANFSFSFAHYYNPNNIQFGALRVLNDDTIAGGAGFAEHPHDNMEIITIPLKGAIVHKDSMGNQGQITPGEIQVMSAGTGVVHSEKNAHNKEALSTLQVWVFPNKKNVEPRYGQYNYTKGFDNNTLRQIVSPNSEDDGLWIHQDAWFSMGKYDAGQSLQYNTKKEGNGMYLFVLEGKVSVADEVLEKRDAIAISDADKIDIKCTENTEFLLIDVPMTVEY